MKEIRSLMDMPITVEIVDAKATRQDIDAVFDYFVYVDETFSTYKKGSEISRINRGEILPTDFSADMREIFRLAEETKRQTNGYFDIKNTKGTIDPSGLVKGWAIYNAAKILEGRGLVDFFVDIGGDIEAKGRNADGHVWCVGIQNPFKKTTDVIKVLEISDRGVATSGTYLRGQHIYNPHAKKQTLDEIVSLTIIGPNVYEADRFATAAFAMGKFGINFIELLPGFEGYSIDSEGQATMTSGFEKYVKNN
jgi:thiamine biosynthesis lipoprotein